MAIPISSVSSADPGNCRVSSHCGKNSAGALAKERGARVVRVESGGALIAVLLELGLVDELALLVHPVIVGSGQPWCGTTGVRLQHAGTEVFKGGVVWSRYCVS